MRPVQAPARQQQGEKDPALQALRTPVLMANLFIYSGISNCALNFFKRFEI
jgi:hypothetical protein